MVTFLFNSCKKYLDAKPDKTLQIPSTISDLQAMLDFSGFLNEANGVSFGEASADDYYSPNAIYNGLPTENKNTYIWNNSTYSNYPNDWSSIYNIINVANIVLDNIDKIPATQVNQNDWNNVKGSALFYRSFCLLEGAFTFCKAYDQTTSITDFGMALKLTSDLNSPTVRSNLQDTYNRIISDLMKSILFLPDLPLSAERPSKASAYALLARTVNTRDWSGFLNLRIFTMEINYSQL